MFYVVQVDSIRTFKPNFHKDKKLHMWEKTGTFLAFKPIQIRKPGSK